MPETHDRCEMACGIIFQSVNVLRVSLKRTHISIYRNHEIHQINCERVQ
jgi:hypothetical protein